MNMISISPEPVPCHICDSQSAVIIPGYARFRRVTSDCKPWKSGGKLSVCPACGSAQAVVDQSWRSETQQIYQDYTIYYQSQGAEQNVFDQASGQALSRSTRLLQRLQAKSILPARGRLMDVGCGNGALLRAFSAITQGWSSVGVEINDHYRQAVEQIPGVEGLFVCPPEKAPGRFQLITLMHAIEHIPSPGEFLVRLGDKLDDGGLLLIQVPDCDENPFMFLVADHASHFTVSTLKELVRRSGYEVSVAATDWVAKEITIVAQKSCSSIRPAPRVPSAATRELVTRRLDWLAILVDATRRLAEPERFGLFGTSIAATWLFAELERQVSFFIDEDPHRIGRTFFGHPIYSPQAAPPDSRVFIALPPQMADEVKNRMERLGLPVQFSAPPPLPA